VLSGLAALGRAVLLGVSGRRQQQQRQEAAAAALAACSTRGVCVCVSTLGILGYMHAVQDHPARKVKC
jgi:hypothetical protein